MSNFELEDILTDDEVSSLTNIVAKVSFADFLLTLNIKEKKLVIIPREGVCAFEAQMLLEKLKDISKYLSFTTNDWPEIVKYGTRSLD